MEQAGRERRIREALLRVAEEAGESLDLGDVLGKICRLIVELAPCDRCTVYLWSTRRRAYLPAADWGTPAAVAARFVGQQYQPGKIQFEETLRAGEPVIMTREDDLSPENTALLDDAESHALAIVPLGARGRPLGSISVGVHQAPGFDEAALPIVQGIARHAANLIDKAQLFRRLEKDASLRAGLAQLAAALAREHDVAVLGRLLCARGADLLGVTDGLFLLQAGDALVPASRSGSCAERVGDKLVPFLGPEESLPVRAVHEGRPLLVNQIRVTDTFGRDPVTLKCALAIPLVGRAGPVGCLVYGDRARTHRFNDDATENGVVLGMIAAAAIERARIFQELTRTNAALRASEEHLRAIIDNSRDVMTILDAAGTIRFASPAIERVLGYGRDDLTSRTVFDFVHPDDRPAMVARLREIEESSAVEPLEFRFRHRGGSWCTLEASGNRLPEGAAVQGIVLSSRDVTDRKRGERRILAQQRAASVLADAPGLAEAIPRILQAICESLRWNAGAMWALDRAAGVLRCADFWHVPAADVQRFEAVSRGTLFAPGRGLPGRVWSSGEPAWIADVVHDENFPRAPIATRDGLHGAFAFPVRSRQGVVGVFEFFSAEIEPEDPELLKLLRLIGDQVGLFIERKEAEEALRESEEQTRLIVDTAQDALVTIDSSGIITGWNREAERTFGWTREDVVGTPLVTTIIPVRYREAHEHGLQHYLTTGEGPVLNRRIEISAVDRDGREFPVELAVWPMRTRGAISFGAFIQDITERKRAEEQLEKARAEAEQRAHELQVQAVELVEARDQALASNRAKTQFLANMSHEIRTPMNGVIGMIQLLLETDLNEEQHDYAVTVRKSADALLTIINDILDVSKIDAGQMRIEVVDFDLRALVEEVVGLLAPRAKDKGLELTCDVPPDIPIALRGDPVRLRQVLTNLLGNAVKFTEAGEVSVSAALLYQTATHAAFRLSVRDTGIGIPRDKHAAIFESFTQVDDSNTRKYSGTGLGLAISRQLVELMEGEIGLESEPGRGSTFSVELQLEKQTEAPVRQPHAALRGVRVLIVDDNATNRLILRKQLEAWGARPAEATSGAEALQQLQASPGDRFGAVLMDLQMPEMDGEETARCIKGNPALADIPLILLSSVGAQDSAETLRAKGFAVALTKPIRQSSLHKALVEVLGERQEAVSKGRAAPAPSLGLHVLVVEDNSINQKVAVGMLQRWGCNVDAVGNGREALRAMDDHSYDVVLMDVQMPEMDGFEATEHIRRREEGTGRRTPIVAMTAYALAGDRERCLAADMDDYVAKPIDTDDLLSALRRCGLAIAPTAASGGPRVDRFPAVAAATYALVETCRALGVEALAVVGDQLDAFRPLAAARSAIGLATRELERLRERLAARPRSRRRGSEEHSSR